jgi:hypothetical protein
MGRIDELHRIRREARRRRVHLSTRASLKLLLRLARRVESLAAALRARLDPAGGAEEPPARSA